MLVGHLTPAITPEYTFCHLGHVEMVATTCTTSITDVALPSSLYATNNHGSIQVTMVFPSPLPATKRNACRLDEASIDTSKCTEMPENLPTFLSMPVLLPWNWYIKFLGDSQQANSGQRGGGSQVQVINPYLLKTSNTFRKRTIGQIRRSVPPDLDRHIRLDYQINLC